MAGLNRTLESVVERIEGLTPLDKLADAVAVAVRKAVPPGPAEDLLSGTPIGHSLHPLLVTVPIGGWTSAVWLDLTGGDAKAARRLLLLGNLAAAPAALTGASDWLSTAGAERRVGLVHAAANDVGIALQTASWLARRRGRRAKGTVLSLAGLAVTAAAGWLGGHLSYALGVGVDTTAFERFPADWADAGAADDVGDGPVRVDVAGVPLVLFRSDGRIVALADRCSHRGGPLDEGTVENGCITCPWHGSVFAGDGAVVSGPATRPQPALDVREQDGRVQVRRGEQRALRTNPVRV